MKIEDYIHQCIIEKRAIRFEKFNTRNIKRAKRNDLASGVSTDASPLSYIENPNPYLVSCCTSMNRGTNQTLPLHPRLQEIHNSSCLILLQLKPS